MGKKIKLNEIEVKEIVSECVKAALNESGDWRFEKFRNRSNDENNEKAQKAFDEKYQSQENSGKTSTFMKGYVNKDRGDIGFQQMHADNPGFEDMFNGVGNDKFQARAANFTADKNGAKTDITKTNNTNLINNPSDGMVNKFNTARGEMSDYYSGNFGNRIKDKAHKLPNWSTMGSEFPKLNESQLIKLVKKCVNETLKQYKSPINEETEEEYQRRKHKAKLFFNFLADKYDLTEKEFFNDLYPGQRDKIFDIYEWRFREKYEKELYDKDEHISNVFSSGSLKY